MKTKANIASLTVVETSKLATIEANIEKLNDIVAKLREADRQLAREDIEMQSSHGSGPTRDEALTQAALELLDGHAPPKPKVERSREITVERARIAKALEIAEQRMTRLLFERAGERRELAMPAWIQLQRERAAAVVHLQKLNRRAQEMLAPLFTPRGQADMPAGFAQKPAGALLLGTGTVGGGEADVFLRACVASGILTDAELKAMTAADNERNLTWHRN